MDLASKYNFKRKYILDTHIVSDLDRRYTSGELKLLFAETNSRCGDCGKPLDWNFEGDINSKHNQVAHIYGKKLFNKVGMPLSKKYHIVSEDEINRYNNLIILCDTCHKEYDRQPTYDKYKRILKYKEKISTRVSNKTYIYFALEDIINRIRDGAFERVVPEMDNKMEEYEKTKLKHKLKFNKINTIKSAHVMNDMRLFFRNLKIIFDEMEDGKKYLKKYNQVYTSLKENFDDKNEIINIINSALVETDTNLFNEIVPIITSYMIMNCEVLENDPQ